MHDIDRTQTEFEPEQEAFETKELDGLELAGDGGELDNGELEGGDLEVGDLEGADLEGGDLEGADLESPFTESEEMELATEMLGISSEAELDQFIGKLLKRGWRRLRKVGSAFGRVVRPLGGILKGVAKKLLPVAAGAAGTFFGGPVGGALGAKLGSMVGGALEAELEGMEPEDREFEVARRFVKMAGTAVKQAAAAQPGADPRAAARTAVVGALKRHVPRVRIGGGSAQSYGARGRSGRWVRRGNRIILFGI